MLANPFYLKKYVTNKMEIIEKNKFYEENL